MMDGIAPLYVGQRVICRRHPLFAPVTVTSVYETAPGVWRFDWIDRHEDRTPITGSAQAAGFEQVGGGL